MPKNAGNLIFELHFLKFSGGGGMPPDPPRKQVPLALAIGRPQCSHINLPLFHLDFQFFNLHLPVLPKSGLAALDWPPYRYSQSMRTCIIIGQKCCYKKI